MAMTKEELKKLAKEMSKLTPEEQQEILADAGIDVDIEEEMSNLNRIQKQNPGKDDRFFLFRWIEDYGCYLGTAALLIIVFLWLFRKDGSSSTEVAENANAFASLITGK